MLSWLKRRGRKELPEATKRDVAGPQGHGVPKEFLVLHKYLVNRYSDVVVLTFAQMEDLLGSPLPATARQDLTWWNADAAHNFGYSNSWRLANRSAVANLVAQTVMFARV
jgi:hypothetical protein